MSEQTDKIHQNDKVVIVSGPSGVGKSTICKEAIKRLNNVYLSVSVTTRPKGKNEVNGQDYWFVSKEEFQERINNGLLLEYAEVFGHLYGTPRDKIDEVLHLGKSVILEIDVQGAKQAKVIYPDAEMIFIGIQPAMVTDGPGLSPDVSQGLEKLFSILAGSELSRRESSGFDQIEEL